MTTNLIVVLVQDLQARNLTRMLKNGGLERCSIIILLNTGHVGFFPGCQSWKNGNPFMEKNTKDFCGDFTGLFGGGTLLFHRKSRRVDAKPWVFHEYVERQRGSEEKDSRLTRGGSSGGDV